MHEKDEDCTVDPETLTCVECGVYHGPECPDCGGSGFHRPGCGGDDRPRIEIGLDPNEFIRSTRR